MLWYSPSARFSNSEATMTTPSSPASRPSSAVLGPGIGSARAKWAWSSVWQKYWLRNSSCRQTICAPFPAASRTPATAFLMFSAGSDEQAICTSPSRTLFRAFIVMPPR